MYTGSDNYSIKMADVSNGLCLYILHKHPGSVNCSAINPLSHF